MKWYNKLILVVTVCAVLLCSSPFVAFASGSTDKETGSISQRKPIFCPEFILISSVDGVELAELNLTAPFYYNSGSAEDSIFLEISGSVVDDTYNYNANYSVNTVLSTGYGYSYNGATFDAMMNRPLAGANIRFAFEDIYLPSAMIRASNVDEFNWLGSFYFLNFSETGYLDAQSYLLTFEYWYCDKTTNDIVHQQASINIPESDSYYSKLVLRHLKSFLLPISQDLAKNGNIVINWLTYDFIGVDYADGISLTGSCKYVDTMYRGFARVLGDWGGDIVVEEVHYDSPSLLESITLGLNAIWNTQIFGLFTIGQIFGACVGLSLFHWFLKIFAGG